MADWSHICSVRKEDASVDGFKQQCPCHRHCVLWIFHIGVRLHLWGAIQKSKYQGKLDYSSWEMRTANHAIGERIQIGIIAVYLDTF